MTNPWNQVTDALLAQKVNRGNVDAFSAVYDKYAPLLLRHLSYRTPNKEIAEDILSKTFLRTWEYICSGKKITYLKQFLYTTAQNCLADHYRKKENSDVITDDLEAYDRPDERDIAAIRLDRTFNRMELDKALAGVKPEFRDVLVMRYFDELEIHEIAKISQSTPNAVYVRLHRALKSLKEQFKTNEPSS